MDVYEKINKAVLVCSVIHSFRNKPGSLQHPKSVCPHPDKVHEREAGDVVPISFDYSSQPKPATPLESSKLQPHASSANTGSPGRVAKSNSEVGSPQFTKPEGNKIHIEESFTTYIDRVRARMRTMSTISYLPNADSVPHVNDGNNASGRDEFSEFIDRAGIKIRTTSSIGCGNTPAS